MCCILFAIVKCQNICLQDCCILLQDDNNSKVQNLDIKWILENQTWIEQSWKFSPTFEKFNNACWFDNVHFIPKSIFQVISVDCFLLLYFFLYYHFYILYKYIVILYFTLILFIFCTYGQICKIWIKYLEGMHSYYYT